MRVTAAQDDTVDLLCHRHLGRTDVLAETLELNHGLAAIGPILPVGTEIELPDQAEYKTSTATTLQLWD